MIFAAPTSNVNSEIPRATKEKKSSKIEKNYAASLLRY